MNDAMTYNLKIGASAARAASAKLVIHKDAFVYARADGPSVAKTFAIEQTGPGAYSVLIEDRSYRATLTARGELVVNGRTFFVDVEDPRKLRGHGSAEGGAGRQTVAAPMPGRVIRILVEAGQEVEAGQGLIVVEAMKMQNEMKSPKSGKVGEIRTSAGAAVAAGEALIVIE